MAPTTGPFIATPEISGPAPAGAGLGNVVVVGVGDGVVVGVDVGDGVVVAVGVGEGLVGGAVVVVVGANELGFEEVSLSAEDVVGACGVVSGMTMWIPDIGVVEFELCERDGGTGRFPAGLDAWDRAGGELLEAMIGTTAAPAMTTMLPNKNPFLRTAAVSTVSKMVATRKEDGPKTANPHHQCVIFRSPASSRSSIGLGARSTRSISAASRWRLSGQYRHEPASNAELSCSERCRGTDSAITSAKRCASNLN
ncbi:MAG TPA: hypothetical protein VNF07_10770 [Acidimicrobiales bacterium]|nr:hypothetical protein [Acidimicrobiales bacterium]